MPTYHVMTVSPKLPHDLLDRVLTASEEALYECGASRVWISTELPDLAVMADVPGVQAVADRCPSDPPTPSDLVG